MGRKKAMASDRVKKAAELRLKDPVLTVLEAMLAANFPIAESKNRGKHMQFRRCLDDTKKTVPPVVGNSAISPVSTLITSTASIATEAAPSCILKKSAVSAATLTANSFTNKKLENK